jgi:hypothetical protein
MVKALSESGRVPSGGDEMIDGPADAPGSKLSMLGDLEGSSELFEFSVRLGAGGATNFNWSS